jgi:hypothetical protein
MVSWARLGGWSVARVGASTIYVCRSLQSDNDDWGTFTMS